MPFDPMNSAAMRAAQSRKAPAIFPAADAPPLSPEQERALIESLADGTPAAPGAPVGMMAEGGTAAHPWTVAELNACLNQLLSVTLPSAFFVEGEISNYRPSDRGHVFFTLKDARAELPCVLWKDAAARLKFKPKDGLAVIIRGAVRMYEPQGKLQVYVEAILPQGAGALELAFRQCCEKLKAEGLFEAARKRKIPRVPRHVVIITSKTGDVLHDVLTTAFRRYPGLHVSLFPVRVQGAQAAGDIVRALEKVNVHHARCIAGAVTQPPVDLILLVRGGGSLEDLWPFNEEIVARAIVASAIPIATGIGHEPDTTIADLVGDLRGATPTGVTELTVPDVRTLSTELAAKAALLTRDLRRLREISAAILERGQMRLVTGMTEALRNRQLRIDLLCRQIERIEPRHAIAQGWRRVEESDRRLVLALRAGVQKNATALARVAHRLACASPAADLPRQRDRIANLESRLRAAAAVRVSAAGLKLRALADHLRVVSPQSVLDRGYSITTTRTGEIVRSTKQVARGDTLSTRVADGEITSTVGKPKQSTLF